MLKYSTKLDFQIYHYQRLFKKTLPKTEIIDYLVSLAQVFKATYTTYQELLYYSKNNDFQGFKETVAHSNPEVADVMSTSLKTLKTHLSRIKNTFQYSYFNGPLEGSINQIKVIERIACGYRNFSNFKYRILISFKVTKKATSPFLMKLPK